MSVTYCIGTKSDKNDIVDFGNLVFSVAHAPTDFKALLPKLYSDRYDFSERHFLCKEDGKIKAMVLLDKFNIKVGNHRLTVGGIGTVSVHPYDRGNGYMKKLMAMAVDEIKNSCDIAELDGQRQRYEYYGFTPGGIEYIYSLTETNLRHRVDLITVNGVEVKKVKSNDVEMLNKIRELSAELRIVGERAGNNQYFYDIMSSWKGEIYALYLSGAFKGYICRKGNGISEMALTDTTLTASFIKEYLLVTRQKQVDISLNPTQQQLVGELSKICEDFKAVNNHCFMPIKYEKIIAAFLELKAGYTPLADGTVVVKIGENILDITLEKGVTTVTKSQKQPTVELCEFEAMRQLFSAQSNLNGELNALPDFAKGWFPLPLYISSVDVC